MIEIGRSVVARSLFIEDLKHNQFFEILHDETASYDEFDDVDSANLELMVDLTDILVCLSRLSFEVFFFRRISGIVSGSSLGEAIERGSLKRTSWMKQFDSETSKDGSVERKTPDFSSLRQDSEGLIPFVELSGDKKAALKDKIIDLSSELRAKVGHRNIYWFTASADVHGCKHQILRFGHPEP